MKCANITLHRREYTLRRNTLVTIYSSATYNPADYNIIPYGYAELCFNYKKSFVECHKWRLDASEYMVNSSRSLIYKAANSSYELGNYELRSDNSSYVCVPEKLLPIYQLEWIFISAWTLSVFSLLIALYLNVPCKRVTKRKYDFRPMYCHMVSFVFSYVFQILFQLTYYPSWGRLWQIFVEYGATYTDCSTFSWLSVVGFDTYLAFHPKKLKADLTCSAKQFCWRSLYAWGLPFVVVTLAVVLERLQFLSQYPHFGMSLQGLEANILNNVLVFGSQILTLGVQFVFCLVTLINIRRGLKVANCSTPTFAQKRKILKIFIKLVVVMSFTSISALTGYAIYFLTKSPLSFFFPAGIALQGVFLFLIHGLGPLKKRMLKLFLSRLAIIT